MKILNIYGQEAWHTEARIVGNAAGLLELRATIDRAIKDGKAISSGDLPLYASDGEGYTVIVECHSDKWGLAGGEESFWNKEKSKPQYLVLERAVVCVACKEKNIG